MTEWGKTRFIIISLLLIPGLALQVHAQYDYPDMPSQEDIAKMMPKEVSGTYSNQEYGISVDFPSGWSGMMTDFTDPQTGTTITSIQVLKGGLEVNMEKLQQGEFEMIMLSIVDKTEGEDLPDPESPTQDPQTDCSYIFAESITFSGKNAMKLETECDGPDTSIKMRAYHYATSDKFATYAYASSPASDFDNNLNTFEDSVKTLSISNLVDIAYEIPEELKLSSNSQMETESPEVESSTETPEITSDTKIPEWVKNTMQWYLDGVISEDEMISAIQFLVNEGIIKLD